MSSPKQHRNCCGMTERVAGIALALSMVLVPTLLATRPAQAQNYNESVLYSFGGEPDGANPYYGALLRDAQGNLYGTTYDGGDVTCNAPTGCGTVFKLDTSDNETVLFTFTGIATGGNGALPNGNLVQDRQGNLYGTTHFGGASGVGLVFKLDTAGKETVFYSFSFTSGGSGAYPAAALVLDAQGNLYGTTSEGGNLKCNSPYGCGTVFKLDKSGNESTVYTFSDSADGEGPAGLIRDAQGNLYGTAVLGGDSACNAPYGCGTVFKVDTSGNETTLYTFTAPDGAPPNAGLVRDAKGNLYGSTSRGGAYNWGTVFEVDTLGNETVLYSFTGAGVDSAVPYGGLVRDPQGNLYGTAGGGTYGWGTVFKLNTTGKETVLYSFRGTGGDGGCPCEGLLRDANGNLYGATYNGGASGFGTAFKLTPPVMTATTLSSSPNPSTYGQPVAFSATVTSKIGTPPDGETISFMKGKTVLGAGTMSHGSASFATSTLPVGKNAVTAVYGGDSKFASSTSKAVSQVVSKATTATALASSLNPSVVGQSVTFTATVTPEFSGKVTGTVTFYDGTTVLKTIGVRGGAAKFTTKTLISGTHSVTATYNGTATFSGSRSTPLIQTVSQA